MTSVDRIKVRDIPGGEPVAGNTCGGPAEATFTLTGQPADSETITIGARTYTFQTVLTDVDGNVLIGSDPSESLDNLVAAINLLPGAGTIYATSTTANVQVYGLHGAGDTMLARALKPGTIGNAIGVSDAIANGSWSGGSLAGGVDGDYIQYTTQPKDDVRFFYDGSDRLEFIGKARPGSRTADPVWQLFTFAYDGSGNLITKLWANNDPTYSHVLDDRASLSYGPQ